MHTKTIWLTKPQVLIRFIALWEQEMRSPFLDDSVQDWLDLLRRLEEKGHLSLSHHKSRAILGKLTDQGYEFASVLIP